MGRRVVARAAERSEDWRDQLWMQARWKTAKQREEQDHVGDLGSGVLDAAFGAVPGGDFGGVLGGDGEARGGARGGEIGGLAGPALDAGEVEDGVAEGGAGPRRDLKMELERSAWRREEDPVWPWSESESESENWRWRWSSLAEVIFS
nr:hypothetical protein CFP56_58368 [Quercus suber]